MLARTVRFDRPLDDAARVRIGAALHAEGGSIAWGACVGGRTYALVSFDSSAAIPQMDAVTFPEPIIAIALYPRPAEALSYLHEALGGDGRPDAMLSCEHVEDALLLEWDPRRADPVLMLAIADAELRRFNGQRVAKLLTPLSAATASAVAAAGLQAPDITPERILDVLIEMPHESA